MPTTSCEMLGWMNHKLESRLQGEISVTLDTQMTHPYGRKQIGIQEPLFLFFFFLRASDEGERGE